MVRFRMILSSLRRESTPIRLRLVADALMAGKDNLRRCVHTPLFWKITASLQFSGVPRTAPRRCSYVLLDVMKMTFFIDNIWIWLSWRICSTTAYFVVKSSMNFTATNDSRAN